MRSILNFVLKLLGLRRKKPKTRLGKIVRRSEHVVSVLIVVYLLFLFFPQFLFANSFGAHGIKIYSTNEIPEQAHVLLSEIRTRIAESDFYRKGDRFTIFLCNSKFKYMYFSRRAWRSFGVAPITGNVFLADVDIAHNISRAFRPDYNERSFVGVAAHEIGHVMIRRRIGFWSARRTPTWIKEGYCEFIAGESSFPKDEGDRLLSQGEERTELSFRYFLYRRMVEFLLNEKNRDIKDIFLNPPLEEEVKMDARKWISERNIEPKNPPDKK